MADQFTVPPSQNDKETTTSVSIQSPVGEENNQTETEIKAVEITTVIDVPNHVNGSLKVAAAPELVVTNPDVINKKDNADPEDEKEPHSLLKWPAKSGKFTKVRMFQFLRYLAPLTPKFLRVFGANYTFYLNMGVTGVN